jgi:ribosomal protein L37E
MESIAGRDALADPRTRCAVCGFSEVRTDEVFDRVSEREIAGRWMLLAECPRCEHRWTSREPIAALGFAARERARIAQRVERGAVREARPAA